MKRYLLSAAILLVFAGIAGAQDTKKPAKEKEKPAVTKTAPMKKDDKKTMEKKPMVEKTKTPTTTTTNKTAGTTPIKRKTHSKAKSVPASK
jgi:hypothetical protein